MKSPSSFLNDESKKNYRSKMLFNLPSLAGGRPVTS
jgi:hypothetical protein